MAQNDGGPAFPRTPGDLDNLVGPQEGMSLRDWFAGQALATPSIVKTGVSGFSASATARKAYDLADAMLEIRDQE